MLYIRISLFERGQTLHMSLSLEFVGCPHQWGSCFGEQGQCSPDNSEGLNSVEKKLD